MEIEQHLLDKCQHTYLYAYIHPHVVYIHTYVQRSCYLFITDDLLLSDFPSSGAMRANTGESTLATNVVSSRQSYVCTIMSTILGKGRGTYSDESRTRVLMDSSGCAMTLTSCGTNGRISSFEITATDRSKYICEDNMHLGLVYALGRLTTTRQVPHASVRVSMAVV